MKRIHNALNGFFFSSSFVGPLQSSISQSLSWVTSGSMSNPCTPSWRTNAFQSIEITSGIEIKL
jgi:hypothetical protein